MEKKALTLLALLFVAFSASVYDWNADGQLQDAINYQGHRYTLVGEAKEDLWSVTYAGSEQDGHRIYAKSEMKEKAEQIEQKAQDCLREE